MKILQINCVYKKGSTGKIVFDIHTELKKHNITSIVCYGRGEKIHEENVYKVGNEYIAKFNNLFSRLNGIQYGGCFISTYKLIRRIKIEKPDVVHLHCLNGFFVNIYWLLAFLKKKKIKTVLTLHAEFMHTGNCSHAYECEKWKEGCGKCPRLKEATRSWLFDRTHNSWIKMKKAMQGFDNLVVVSVSPWLESRAKESPILRGKVHHTILNGIETKTTFFSQEFKELKKMHNLSDEKIILHVTANFSSEVKGGKYIRELAEKLKNEPVKIIVIGNTNKNMKLPRNIIDVGRVENQEELAKYYSLADLTIITSKRETFSMICAESLACGTPVVGFKAGAPEQIALKEYSDFVEYGDLDKLEECVRRWIDKKNKVKLDLIGVASSTYSKEKMSERYIEIYNE